MKRNFTSNERYIFARRIILLLSFTLVIYSSLAATITSTSSGGTWSVASTWTQTSRSGLILATVFSPTVTGIGTSFTTQLAVGSIIYNGSVVGTVASIQSNTSLTLTSNSAQTIVVGIGYTAQVVPSATDDAVIAPGATVTVTGNTTINAVTFANTGSSTGTLNVNSGCTLTITAALTLQNRATSNTSAALGGSGTISCASLAVGNNSPPTTASTTYTHQLTSSISQLNVSGNLSVISRIGSDATRKANGSFLLSSGTLTIGGNITTTNGNAVNTSTFSTASGSQSGTVALQGNSPFNFSGTGINSIVLNGSSATINYTGSGTQTITADTYTNLTSSGTGARVLTASGTIAVAGTFTPGTNSYTVDGSTINFNGTGSQSIPSFTFDNLVISNTITLNAYDTVLGVLSFGAAGKTLNAAGYLTLKSTAAKTASIADITNAGSYSGNSVTGNVVIERYIQAARGWRLFSVPISSTGAPTINAAWQEGATTASGIPNPNPGYGIQIAGGTTANGFDQSPTNNPFIKTYDNATNSFIILPANPGTNISLTSYPAYCVYIRGDRGINLMQGLAAAITSTTMRMKGDIKMGNQATTVNAHNFTLLSNPYPSAIDFETITRSNVKNTLYMWDPELAGTWGVGGYVTVSWNSATSEYDVTACVNPINQYIQSGTAFLVSSADNTNPGTLTIKETDKTTQTGASRTAATGERMRVNLYLVNSTDSSASLLDGVLTTYSDINMNIVDDNDAKKITGSNENIGIRRESNLLAIERRQTIAGRDTVFLNLAQMKIQDYKLQVISDNLNTGNRIAVIKDNYSNTINNMPLNLDGTTEIYFSVNSDPASRAADRFSIVFENMSPVPVTFRSVTASKQQKNIVVKWQVENQLNIQTYEVESAVDGRNFITSAIIPAVSNNSYTWIDLNVSKGDHYYRIKSVGHSTDISHSNIVKVRMDEMPVADKITISPNPVKGNIIPLQLNEVAKGIYTIQVLSMNGQVLRCFSIQHDGGSGLYSLPLNRTIPGGKYLVHITGGKLDECTNMIKCGDW